MSSDIEAHVLLSRDDREVGPFLETILRQLDVGGLRLGIFRRARFHFQPGSGNRQRAFSQSIEEEPASGVGALRQVARLFDEQGRFGNGLFWVSMDLDCRGLDRLDPEDWESSPAMVTCIPLDVRKAVWDLHVKTDTRVMYTELDSEQSCWREFVQKGL